MMLNPFSFSKPHRSQPAVALQTVSVTIIPEGIFYSSIVTKASEPPAAFRSGKEPFPAGAPPGSYRNDCYR